MTILKREDHLKQIGDTLATLQAHIKLRGLMNLYDSHIVAEDFMAGLFNIVFGYQLHNLNRARKNQPGIDLGDSTNGIAFQITAEKTKRKIQARIDSFIAENLYREYPELFFFVLQEKQERYASFDTKGCFSFDYKKHILDFGDLMKQINILGTEKLEQIVEFLDREVQIPGKNEAVNPALLDELLNELPTIKNLDFYHPDFQRWHSLVKTTLRRIFGEGSYPVLEYDKIAWHTSDEPEDADDQHGLYVRSCIAAEGQLKAIIRVRRKAA